MFIFTVHIGIAPSLLIIIFLPTVLMVSYALCIMMVSIFWSPSVANSG